MTDIRKPYRYETGAYYWLVADDPRDAIVTLHEYFKDMGLSGQEIQEEMGGHLEEMKLSNLDKCTLHNDLTNEKMTMREGFNRWLDEEDGSGVLGCSEW